MATFFPKKVFTTVKIYEKFTIPNNIGQKATFIDLLKFSQDYGYSIGYVY